MYKPVRFGTMWFAASLALLVQKWQHMSHFGRKKLAAGEATY